MTYNYISIYNNSPKFAKSPCHATLSEGTTTRRSAVDIYNACKKLVLQKKEQLMISVLLDSPTSHLTELQFNLTLIFSLSLSPSLSLSLSLSVIETTIYQNSTPKFSHPDSEETLEIQMSSRSSSTDNSFDVEELLQIETRCRELRKEKDMLRDSQPQSFELIRRLELHVKTLSEARAEDEKRIQELERELNNCSQEIDYLQDQLNARNEENYCLGEHVHSLELKIAETGSLEETVGSLSEELNWSNSERLFLMQELESKEVELQNSASCIEKLEESVSSVALEYQCEIESMKLDMTTLEQRFFEVKKLQEEDAREKVRMNVLIQDLEIQIQNDQEIIGSLEKENKELRFKFETSQRNAEVFCRKIEEEFKEWLERNDGPPLSNQSLSRDLEENFSTCGNILGPLLSRLPVAGATDADLRGKMDKMSSQIREYELLVKQLKVEVKEEKSKARDEAEDLAQEMAELRYQLTGLLEEERKRRACIEQISLQRIAQLEAQIKRERTKSFNSVRLIHEA